MANVALSHPSGEAEGSRQVSRPSLLVCLGWPWAPEAAGEQDTGAVGLASLPSKLAGN